ncbi:oviduct-specific glycoprotein [Diaporthe helianthi]|uniref:chitinase n=1 Tax=Diaporthe helianthi TaxID=158607 RepID=A0A2P5I3I4_DIAHE|nr:oviduct-specific glycoprotein [Diaporthe helianthi]
MCGEFSEDADMPCGMKLCCSATGWCGTTEPYCGNADPAHGTLPCQAGYGSCAITGPPSCAQGGGTTKGRKIGYYQSWNQRDRKCNKVAPKQLNTDGYTHLFFSFASIDPTTFRIAPAHPDDIQGMKDFTALSKDGKVQTWIAVGGFDFSNPGTATHTTCSVKEYMDEYGFQGIDLDWEYPGAPERGGKKLADTRNLSLLVKEMRAAYGTAYGISLTLAPDYWYLRWFDAKAMEPNVDFFGFMAYDLHGSWDQDVKTLGSKVRGQADIQEISKNTEPLWFDGLNPAKINFGLAMYGRGYTLSDPSCNSLLCSFSGPSKAGPCTNFDGVMSLVEIKQLIKQRGLEPKYLADSMMKQITWDDQWIGYDDEDTFAAKMAWADGLCFGGTMVWSIDFQEVGSGGPDGDSGFEGDPVYLAPAVYTGEPAQCTAPCVFVLPPTELSSPTTISIPPYTTSLEIGSGSTTTIVVTVPPLTTNSMEFYNVPVSTQQATGSFQPTPSFNFPPLVTTLTGPGDSVQTITLTIPPWPRVSSGGSGGTAGPGGQPEISTRPTSDRPPIPLPSAPVISKPPYNSVSTPPGQTTGATAAVWPSGTFTSVPTPVPEEGEDDEEGHTSSCKVWFFFVCIQWDDISIQGWKWPSFPPGIIGPGPPPHIEFPPGITLHGTLPPWPRITIGSDLKPTYPPKPADCEPQSASLCKTTSSFGTTVNAGVTRTTTTEVKSTCATVVGCKVEDVEATTTVPNSPACTRAPPKRDLHPDGAEGETLLEERWDDPNVWWMCGEMDGDDGIILPAGNTDADQQIIRNLLDQRDLWLLNNNIEGANGINNRVWGYKEVRAHGLDFTAFYYVRNLGTMAQFYFGSDMVPQIRKAYWWKTPDLGEGNWPFKRAENSKESRATNDTETPSHNIKKRAIPRIVHDDTYYLSQISIPPGVPWDADTANHIPSIGIGAYYADPTLGQGQTIYAIDHEIDETHTQIRDRTGGFERIPFILDGFGPAPGPGNIEHGTRCAFFAIGGTMGIAPAAKLVFAPEATPSGPGETFPGERDLESIIMVANHLEAHPENWGAASLYYSLSYPGASDYFLYCMSTLFKGMTERYGLPIAVSAGNDGENDEYVNSWPSRFNSGGDMIPGMITVGASKQDGTEASFTQDGWGVDVFAPGADLPLEGFLIGGTSYSAPQVAALIAYLRAIGLGDTDAAQMRRLIKFSYSRPLAFTNGFHDRDVNIIWNGQNQCDPPGLGARQEDGGACPLPGNGGNGLPSVPAVTYRPGPAGPLCTADCGELCSGYYCVPTPTGTPPDFTQVPGGGLPTLAPIVTTTSCGSGSATATSTQCAGNNGHSACVTRQVCTKTTTTSDPPASTPTRDPGMYCYRDHNENGQWKAFKDTDAQGKYKTTCESDLQLSTSGLGFIGSGDGMYFSLKWSDDQTGCKGKKAFTLKDNCYDAMTKIGMQCDAEGREKNENYGGLYRQNGDYGCVEFLIRRT